MITITTRHDSAYEPGGTLPPGFYNAMVFQYEEKMSRSNNPMVVLELGVYEKPEHEALHLHIPAKFYLTYQPKAQDPWWKFAKVLAACGNTFGAGETINLEPGMLTGKRVAVRTSLNPESQGGLFMQVDDIISRDKVPHFGVLYEDEYPKYKLDSNGVRAGAGSYTAPAQPAPAAPSYVVEGDDIPF